MLTNSITVRFLMYRVELKVDQVVKLVCLSEFMFLMYRVELKVILIMAYLL